MDGGAWWAAVHGVAKSRTRLSDFPFTFHFPALEKAVAPHSSALAWKIPGTEEPGGLQSMGSPSRTRLSDFTFTFHFPALEKEMATHSSILAWGNPGTEERGGLPSMGSQSRTRLKRLSSSSSNILTNSVGRFSFLYILSRICYL